MDHRVSSCHKYGTPAPPYPQSCEPVCSWPVVLLLANQPALKGVPLAQPLKRLILMIVSHG